jgi:drug/metabolite transporter (DMT)-like permease
MRRQNGRLKDRMTLEFLWIPVTLVASVAQTARNALQKNLTATLGTIGATHVRFLYGLPFAVVFVAAIALAQGQTPPLPGPAALAWTVAGALAQIGGTALMLAAMRARSFAVTIAMLKTEPVLVALAGLPLLGEAPSAGGWFGIAVATLGVVLVSLAGSRNSRASFDPGSIGLGLAAGGLFAASAIGFRGAILALPATPPLLAASTILVATLFIQTVVLSLWLAAFERPALVATLHAWRPSLAAGFTGAFASQLWFFAFALTSAANVRTLALVEVVLAQMVSGRLKETVSRRELAGMALIVAGVAALLLH